MAATADTTEVSLSPVWRERLRRAVLGYGLNPLLVRDLRSFLRGRRPIALQVGYLVLLMVAMAVAALIHRTERMVYAQHGGMGYPGQLQYGYYMFVAMFETQVVLLCLIVVGYSAGAIALEHEKRTFEMLAVTTLSTLEIVIGKVVAVTSLCAMLLTTSLPLGALCILLGGLSPGQMLLAYALLLYAMPFWSAGCVLISVLVGRTIGAYVAALVGMHILLTASFYLSGLDASGPNFGAMSPFVLPFPEVWAQFTLFKAHLPAWLPPLVVYGVLCALCIVAAAEAVPLHRPRRSAALRLLLLSAIFLVTFLAYSAIIEQSLTQYMGRTSQAWSSAQPPGALDLLDLIPDGLLFAWMLACLSVPIFTSYLPPGEAYRNPIGWLLGPLSIRAWLQRESNAGWRSALLCFTVFAVGLLLPLIICQVTGVASGPLFTSHAVAVVLFSAMLYMISICAYSFWGAAFSLTWRDRRISALFAVLLILILNVLALYSEASPYSFRKAQFVVHPIVVLTSPFPAVHRVLGGGGYRVSWGQEWRDPAYLFGVSVVYQAAIALGGLWYLRRVARRQPVPRE